MNVFFFLVRPSVAEQFTRIVSSDMKSCETLKIFSLTLKLQRKLKTKVSHRTAKNRIVKVEEIAESFIHQNGRECDGRMMFEANVLVW